MPLQYTCASLKDEGRCGKEHRMGEKKILVVDDEKAILDLFKKAFTRYGYVVRTAESGEEALGIVKDEKIWVMFLDLKLPGMTGVELCRRIRKEYPLTIAFAVTGYASLFVLSDCREAGFDDYFVKPVDLSLLVYAAEKAFERLERWGNK